jgi:hypothetical protein
VSAAGSCSRPLRLGALAIATLVAVGATVRPAAAQVLPMIAEDPPVTTAELEAALSAYGRWIDVPTVGRVWKPDPAVVGEDFSPYLTNGHWLYDAQGWTFDSRYPWGWAAFHFGSWLYLAPDGWVWMLPSVPVWGPAWVSWRTGGGFTGWLPLLPAGAVVDPAVYGTLWSVVALRNLQRPDLTQHLVTTDSIAFAVAGAPPGRGTPVVPLAAWRGYPHLRAALAAASGVVFVPTPLAPGSNPALWFGRGSSVHAPVDMGYAVGASPLWTGPGSSVHASPAFGASPQGQTPQVPRGWSVSPRRPRP